MSDRDRVSVSLHTGDYGEEKVERSVEEKRAAEFLEQVLNEALPSLMVWAGNELGKVAAQIISPITKADDA